METLVLEIQLEGSPEGLFCPLRLLFSAFERP